MARDTERTTRAELQLIEARSAAADWLSLNRMELLEALRLSEQHEVAAELESVVKAWTAASHEFVAAHFSEVNHAA